METTDTRVMEPELMEPEASAPLARAERPQDDRRPAAVVGLQESAGQRGQPQENVRVIVRHSEECALLFAAIAEAQSQDGYGDIEKTKSARIKSKRENGADYGYTYETLDDVLNATRPFLARAGIASMQFAFPGQTSMTIRTMLAHKSGQFIYNDLSAAIPMPDPQGVGSAATYLRRYALKAICNVAARDEDDDGNRASRREPPQEAPRPAPRRSEAQPQRKPEPAAVQDAGAEGTYQRAAEAGRSTRATAQPAPDAPAAPAAAPPAPRNVGIVQAAERKGTAMRIVLDTGFTCSTQSGELMRAIEGYLANGARVELNTKPSRDPSKFVPILEEIVQQRG